MKRLVAGLALLMSVQAGAQARGAIACKTLFADLPHEVSAEQRTAFAQYSDINSSKRLDGVIESKDILTLFADQDLPVFGERLVRVFDNMWGKAAAFDASSFYMGVRRSMLRQRIPRALVEKGIRENRAGDVSSLRRLLGNLTLEETRSIYMGHSGSGLEFTPDSLLGKYVAESGASVKAMDVPDMNGARTYPEKKLFVAVSEESFPLFQKYFDARTFVSSLGHGAVVQGQLVTDVWGRANALGVMSEFSPLPMVILKPSEGERLHRYLSTATMERYKNWSNALKQPWRLNAKNGETYVKQGAYTCCTNYWGNIPIGDKLVESYALPLVNEYGAGGAAERQPIVRSKLLPWENAEESALRNIWTVPGHQQLSEVLGHLERNVNGEFASPGWVIQTLMGEVSSERVPVIFIFMKNHKSDIPSKPQLHYEKPV
jgi:hypothetical protein